MSTLAWNRYGKARVRLVKVRRQHQPHEVADMTLDVQLEGTFEPVYVDGNNEQCVATDTMKNTVYALARHDDIIHIEAFAERLALHFFDQPPVTVARVSVTEHPWTRIAIAEQPHPHAFLQPGGEEWTAVVTCDSHGAHVAAGLANLVLMKTTDSAFAGFPRDKFTTLAETADRILATAMTASWKYRSGFRDFSVRERIRQALVETFAAHDSRSVQHTLYAMARHALDVCADITEITMSLPNRHHLLVDLTPFGLDNPNEVFVATDQPYGLIEATVRRG